MLDAATTSTEGVVSDHLINSREPVPMNNITPAPSDTFKADDGALNIAVNEQEQYEAHGQVPNFPELLTDNRFRTLNNRKCNRDDLREELHRSSKATSAQDRDETLLAMKAPSAPAVFAPIALRSEQIRHRSFVPEVELATSQKGRRVEALGTATHVDESPVRPATPVLRLGEHAPLC
ncbi:CoA transferase [Rhodococcus sp. Rp3]|uniref:CoA transferase n=1 Tax=Rhodococcus sp. Rp3 TaxID=2807635 RepID=UPI00233F2C72|nr:CoA transferase [Rhodococcus sp. Rp3]MDC3724400.1 CoA transferase [Rhodococcus sp. Rp3]